MFCPECGTNNKDNAKFCIKCGLNLWDLVEEAPEAVPAQPAKPVLKVEVGKGSVLDNRYEIIGIIEKGGMGAVYRALDTRLDNTCAVKEMRDSFEKIEYRNYAIDKFKSEALILSKLRHPNIPRVWDFFVENNRYYLVMDFVEGTNLHKILHKRSKKRCDEEEATTWAIQLCDVLSYLHRQDPPIIYRDIKPANIMVTVENRVVLIDFGIARIFTSKSKGTMIGTQGYSPPEQYRGKTDQRSDIYALGATLHHLITGKDPQLDAPFSFPPVKKLRPDISERLSSIIEKCLKFAMDERYQTADELKLALEAKIPAPPPPRSESMPAFSRGLADIEEEVEVEVEGNNLETELELDVERLPDKPPKPRASGLIQKHVRSSHKKSSAAGGTELTSELEKLLSTIGSVDINSFDEPAAAPAPVVVRKREEARPTDSELLSELFPRSGHVETSAPHAELPDEEPDFDSLDESVDDEPVPEFDEEELEEEEELEIESSDELEEEEEEEQEPELELELEMSLEPDFEEEPEPMPEPVVVKPAPEPVPVKPVEPAAPPVVQTKTAPPEPPKAAAPPKAAVAAPAPVVEPVFAPGDDFLELGAISEFDPDEDEYDEEEYEEELLLPDDSLKPDSILAFKPDAAENDLFGRLDSDDFQPVSPRSMPIAQTPPPAARHTAPFAHADIPLPSRQASTSAPRPTRDDIISAPVERKQTPPPRQAEPQPPVVSAPPVQQPVYPSVATPPVAKKSEYELEAIMGRPAEEPAELSAFSYQPQFDVVKPISIQSGSSSVAPFPEMSQTPFVVSEPRLSPFPDIAPQAPVQEKPVSAPFPSFTPEPPPVQQPVRPVQRQPEPKPVPPRAAPDVVVPPVAPVYTPPPAPVAPPPMVSAVPVPPPAQEKQILIPGWGMHRGNVYRNGKNPVARASSGKLKWRYHTNGRIYSSPITDEAGNFYIGSNDGCMYCLNSEGQEKWRFMTGSSIYATPLVVEGHGIFFGTEDYYFYAVNFNGKELWKLKFGGSIYSSACTGSDGTIYVGCNDGNFYAITPDGREKWCYAVRNSIYSSPSIGPEGNLYIGAWDKHLYALSPSGRLQWKFPTQGNIDSSPAIDHNGNIYFGSYDGIVYSLEPNSRMRWKFKTRDKIYSSPAIEGKHGIFFGSYDNYIYCVSLEGNPRWRQKTNYWIKSSAAVDGLGNLYIGGEDFTLYSFTQTGESRWKLKTNGSIESSPCISNDGVLVVGSCDGWVYAFE
ncbi:MAG: PQQ-binding-like beta-propeller repeat protein [Firmicutes bacterium]|nr:PQQ-binding-like beta-propeller repeat protein [Bacillota bacterium]